jgi:hypothetical protein
MLSPFLMLPLPTMNMNIKTDHITEMDNVDIHEPLLTLIALPYSKNFGG